MRITLPVDGRLTGARYGFPSHCPDKEQVVMMSLIGLFFLLYNMCLQAALLLAAETPVAWLRANSEAGKESLLLFF